MKKAGLFILQVMLFSHIAFAQNVTDSKDAIITGKVVGRNGNPLEYVNIILHREADSSIVTGTITDLNGKFELHNIKTDNYYIKAKFIGYGDVIMPNVRVTASNKIIKLDALKLESSSYQLDGVDVEANTLAVEYKLEKKIINVGTDIDAGIGSAMDILVKTSSVNTDVDGAISLRGDTDVIILIDGRPFNVGGNSSLSSIPASSIDKIEIITNPSAKYQAEGTAGIINVILKKNKKDVVSSLVNITVGTSDKYAGSLGAFYSKGKYFGNIQLIYDDMTYYRVSSRTRKFTFSDSVVNFRDDFKNRYDKKINNSISICNGLNFKNMSVTLDTKYGVYEFYNFKQGIQKKWYNINTNETSIWNENERRVRWNYLENNLSFKIKPNNPKHNIDVNLFHSTEVGRNNYESLSYPIDMNEDRIGESETLLTRQDGSYHFYQGAIDYSFSIDSANRIEAGIFAKYMNNPNVVKKGVFDNISNSWNMYDDLQYKVNVNHNIYAAYMNYSGQYQKIEYQAGIRYEIENRDIYLTSIDSSFLINALDLFPSFSAMYKMHSNFSIIASYSKRKRLPRPWQTIPLNITYDYYSQGGGNPNLKPVYADKYEAGLQYSWKKITGSFTGFYKYDKNEIFVLQRIDNNFIQTLQHDNIPEHITKGIEMDNKFAISQYLSTSIKGSVFHNNYKGEYNSMLFDNKNYAWNCSFVIDISFTKTTKFQIFNAYYSDYALLQGGDKANYFTNLSFNQSFYNKSLTFSIKANDIFSTREMGSFWEWEGYEAHYSFLEKRYLLFNLSYNFNRYNLKNNTSKLERGSL
jgi:hypothetical protein